MDKQNKKPRCVVANCENKGRHEFPRNEVRRRQWIEAIKHFKPGMTIKARSEICSDHFRPSDFSAQWDILKNVKNYHPSKTLKKSSVPSLFPWNKTAAEDPSLSSSILNTPSFNTDQVKATYSRVQPAVVVEEQNNMISTTVNDEKNKTSKKKLQCIVDNCKNEGKHKFPKNEVRRRQWTEAIKHLKPRMTVSANSLICSDHFRLSVFPWNKTSVEVKIEPTSSTIQHKFKQNSSCVQIKLEELSAPIQEKLEQPRSSIQVKVEKPSSSIQVKLEPPSSPTQDEVEQPLSPVQVKPEKPSSTYIEVELEPLSLSVQDKSSFKPDQVKANKPRAPPTVSVKDYDYTISMLTDNPNKLSKKKLKLRISKMCRCIVFNCRNKGRHQLPRNEVRRKQWLDAIKYVKPGMNITTRSLICSDHFQPSDFSVQPSYWNSYCSNRILRRTVIPSVFPWNKATMEVKLKQQSIHEAVSFNPNQVKATYSRALPPRVYVAEQNYIVPTASLDPNEDPLQMSDSFSD